MPLRATTDERGTRPTARRFLRAARAAGRHIVLVAALASTARAQEAPFPSNEFRHNDSLALAMTEYDRCAWLATDTLLATLDPADRGRLGREWFCFEQNGRWHAAFGRYDPSSDRYDLVAHLEFTPGHVSASATAADPERMASRARAIHNALTRMPRAVDESGARFNTYVLASPDSSLEVWFLPAWQASGIVLFGAELSYRFDPTGRELLDEHVVTGPMRGIRPDTSVAFRLDSPADSVPTVGDLFFYYLTRDAFHSIRIQTRHFSSSLVPMNGREVWVHVAREP